MFRGWGFVVVFCVVDGVEGELGIYVDVFFYGVGFWEF